MRWYLIGAIALPLVLVLLMGRPVIGWLHRLHFGQTIYDLGPQAHKSKQGTPVMGGLMMAAAVLVTVLLCGTFGLQGFWDPTVGLLLIAFLSMAVGFADDFIKAVKRRHEGLTPWQKIAGQVVAAVGFACYCYFNPLVGSAVKVPFAGIDWNLGVWYIPLMTLVIIFMVNSANLQDGVDGILSTVSAVGDIAWAALALVTLLLARVGGISANETALWHITVFGLAMAGAAMGFLRFNRHPARVFMGDTGSMFIGGATVGMALMLRQPFLLLLIAFPMVMSSVSVILQRYYFKLTHGKRIFKMSPLHHHFELSGYSETQIVSMYAVVTALLSVIAVAQLL